MEPRDSEKPMPKDTMPTQIIRCGFYLDMLLVYRPTVDIILAHVIPEDG